MADYIPNTEGELLTWLGTFQTNLATHGPTCGLIAADVTAGSGACTETAGDLNAVQADRNTYLQTVATKNMNKKENIALIRALVNRIKAHPAYTVAIGTSLGIIGTDPEVAEEEIIAQLTGQAFPGYVRLKFKKKFLDGVNIYTRLKGQPGWTFLARDTESPYDDHRQLSVANTPETREYMCIGVIGDTEVGQQSDIVSVVFGG